MGVEVLMRCEILLDYIVDRRRHDARTHAFFYGFDRNVEEFLEIVEVIRLHRYEEFVAVSDLSAAERQLFKRVRALPVYYADAL